MKKNKKKKKKKKIVPQKNSLNKQLNLAVKYHMSGDLLNAEKEYKKALEVKPDNPQVLSNLGSVIDMQGRLEEAVEYHKKALAIIDLPEANYNLANAYVKLQKKEEAVEIYKKALSSKPDYKEAKNNLVLVLANIGLENHNSGNYIKALDYFKESLNIQPTYSTYLLLGNTYVQLEYFDDAIDSYNSALKIKKTLAAYNNIGNILIKQSKFQEAVEHYHKGLEFEASNSIKAESLCNLGIAYYQLYNHEKAVECAKASIELDPGYAKSYYILGVVNHDWVNLDKAIAYHKKSIECDYNFASSHYDLGQIFLLQNNFEEGWKEYEWRWKREDYFHIKRNLDIPEWDGSNPDKKKILVWGEQGMGDEVRFVSMVPDLLKLGAHVTLESDPRLIPLFSRSFPGIRCIEKHQPCPDDIEYHISSVSLGQYFRNSLESFPKEDSYLKANPLIVETLKKRYTQDRDKIVVGIAWTTSSVHVKNASALKPLILWDDILKTQGVFFVNLQYGDRSKEIEEVRNKLGVEIFQDENIDSLKNLDTFAAQVDAMDLVISTSNSNFVVAAALGKPVWMVQSTFPPMWSLSEKGEKTPWHPSVKIFRWPDPNGWQHVKQRVAMELGNFVKNEKW